VNSQELIYGVQRHQRTSALYIDYVTVFRLVYFPDTNTDLTVFRVRAANIARRPCSDSCHVTAPYKLSFYYCCYYYYIVIAALSYNITLVQHTVYVRSTTVNGRRRKRDYAVCVWACSQ